MQLDRQNPDGLSRQRQPIYPHVVALPGPVKTAFPAGQVARDEHGTTVGVGDVTAQTEQVIQNLKTALASEGGALRDFAEVTVYTTDLRHVSKIDAVRRRRVIDVVPASTPVEFRKLAHPDYLVEIDGVAVVS